MKEEKEENEMVTENKEKIFLNLSPSSINIYYQSPLLFYLKYIAKAPDDTEVPVCYGISGSIVHECLEKYAKKEISKDEAYVHLLNKWEEQKMNEHEDINGNTLNPIDYISAMIRGIKVVDEHEEHICEETITFPLKENEKIRIGIKGIIDLQAREKNDKKYVVLDYKTSNSVSEDGSFERQALFYNLLIQKKKNIIPEKTSLHYLKLGIKKDYVFGIKQIEEFEKELDKIADNILTMGTNIENYPLGKIDDLFNSKKQACLREMERRKKVDKKLSLCQEC